MAAHSHRQFRVGISPGFQSAAGRRLLVPQALEELTAQGIHHRPFTAPNGIISAEEIAGFDALLLLGERLTAQSLVNNDSLLGVARWGVGYDNVDIAACTAQGVCVFITPNSVRRPVAMAILTFLLAMTMKLRPKDALVRTGEWDRKTDYMGEGLTGKTLGSFGLGNIGRELFRLAAPLDMRHIAHDPYLDPARHNEAGVQLVDRETLFREADILCVNCPLTAETRQAIGTAELGLMKSSAYLINTARGPIVDQDALIAALQNDRIRGAALDVFEEEPLPLDSPLLALPPDKVWFAPHALAWTEELALNQSMEDVRGLVRLSRGEVPDVIVNKDVVNRSAFQEKLHVFRPA